MVSKYIYIQLCIQHPMNNAMYVKSVVALLIQTLRPCNRFLRSHSGGEEDHSPLG